MILKSNIISFLLFGCLSFLQLTSHALQLSEMNQLNLGSASKKFPAAGQIDPRKNITSTSKNLNINFENPKANFNDIYKQLKSEKSSGTTKVEGGVAAGGGSIIIYPDTKTGEIKAKTIEIYQITEGPAKANFTLDTGPGTTLEEKINYVLNRLSKASGLLAEMYGTWINELLKNPKESDDYSDLALPRVEDTGAVKLPPGGKFVQVFIQQLPGELNLITNQPSKRYLWNKKIFYSLDLDSQVALLFHEVIYRDYREVNVAKNTNITMNSQKIQYVTALVLSKEIEKYFINYNSKERYNINELSSDYKTSPSILFTQLLLKQGLGKEKENLIKFSVKDEIQSLSDPTKLFHFVDCDSILKLTGIYYKNYFHGRCPQDISEYKQKAKSHILFENKLEENLQKNLQFNITKPRNLDFLGFDFYHHFGISYLYKSPDFKNIEVVMNSFQNENEIEVSNLRSQIFAKDLGFKIYIKNELELNVHFNFSKNSENEIYDEKFLQTRGSKNIKFEFDNLIIEATCGRYYYSFPVCFISDENKLENIKIYNSNGQLLASQLSGKVDLRNKDKMGRDLNYATPLDRFQIIKGSDAINLSQFFNKLQN